MNVSIEKRVKQAAAALVRGEEANWELARLTHESTYRQKDSADLKNGRLSMKQWCERVQAESERRFGQTPGYIYREVWERYKFVARENWPTWSEAYWEARGTTPDESFAGARLRGLNSLESLNQLDAGAKQQLADRLMADPDTEQMLEQRFVEKAVKDLKSGLLRRIERLHEEYYPEPIKHDREPSGWDWLIGLGLGSSVGERLQRDRDGVHRLCAYLEQNQPLSIEAKSKVERILESYDEARQLIGEYQDLIREAAGVSVDATFRRLVGEER